MEIEYIYNVMIYTIRECLLVFVNLSLKREFICFLRQSRAQEGRPLVIPW